MNYNHFEAKGRVLMPSQKSSKDSKNYQDIYVLLENLVSAFVSNESSKILLKYNASQYLINCTNSVNDKLPYNEESIVRRISNQLAKDEDMAKENERIFLRLYEQILGLSIDPKKRCAIFTFLYQMSNIRGDPNMLKEIPSTTSGLLVDPKDTLPPNKTSYIRDNDRSRKFYNNNDVTPTSSSRSLTSISNKTKIVDISNFSTKTQTGGGRSSRFNDLVTKSSEGSLAIHSLNTDLVQSIIYSFTGIQSKYLKKDIVTGKFKIDPKVKTLNEIQTSQLLRLSELGFYHDKLQAFTDNKNGACANGLMGQGFISAIRNELTRYYGLIAMLQEQLNRQRDFGTDSVSTRMSNGESGAMKGHLTPLKILVWSVEPLHRLQWLVSIADACQELKGGALASKIYSYLDTGIYVTHNLVKSLLLAVCGPLYRILSNWLLAGEISDPKNEFFIECLKEVGQDRLWHDKYRVRESMLPDFISSDTANKILVIGKSINFLNELCGDKDPTKYGLELHNCIRENPENIFSLLADTKLHSIIDTMYLHTSKRVLDVVVGAHKLLDHLQAMRRYLLLGQGDFISLLMSSLKNELDKPAKELYTYDLSSIMDNAIRTTNAQYEDPEILDHLDVRLIAPCDGDIGWDILSLQYTVRGPLATMLDPSMGIYQLLFKPLWRMKHMEFLLTSKIWKDQKCYGRIFRDMKSDLLPIWYSLHYITAEMNHFIHQMEYYILFEVIECCWVELQKRIEQAKALDDILAAHNTFLETIKCGAFLDSDSSELFGNLDSVYESIVSLEMWQDKFFAICMKEYEAKKKFEKTKLQLEAQGVFSVTAETQLQRDQDRKYFEMSVSSQHKTLDGIAASYDKAARCFLLTLNTSNIPSLRLFGVRLDFNEYYKKRDQRLGKPFTFEHMRMSNVFFNSSNKSILGSRYSSVN